MAQDFDLMYEQTKALKEGKPVQKPIYNHVSGKLDPAEEIKAPKVGPSSVLLCKPWTRLLLPLCEMDCGTSQLNRPADPGHLRLLRLQWSGPLFLCHSVACRNAEWWPTTRSPAVAAGKHRHLADVCAILCHAQILVIEGLHPFYDERVRDLLDFKIYLDISDDVKFAWKLQVHCGIAIQYTCSSAQSNASCVACHCRGSESHARHASIETPHRTTEKHHVRGYNSVEPIALQRDMAERGHSEESIKASIEARKPDFDAYIDPQKKNADVIIQVHTWQCVSVGLQSGPTLQQRRDETSPSEHNA